MMRWLVLIFVCISQLITAFPAHASPQQVNCSVFDNGYSNKSHPSGAIYFATAQQACVPDGTALGTCRRWFGQCTVIGDNSKVNFSVFNSGGANKSAPSDAVYIPSANSACVPGGPAGICRRWFGMPTTADGRKVECFLFDDGNSRQIGPTTSIYFRAPGQVCLPDGTAAGGCRKWFGLCQISQAPIISGSYQQSCTDILWTDNTLSAQCKDLQGHSVAATLPNAQTCIGDIQNVDGNLRCNLGTTPPPGSYRNACPYVWTNGPDLGARCVMASFFPPIQADVGLSNFKGCVGDIFLWDPPTGSSTNHGLTCSRAPLPPGTYRNSCFSMWVEANTLRAYCKNQKGYAVTTALENVGACHQDIANADGSLICGPIPTFQVPTLIGLTLADARKAITAANLTLGRVSSGCTGFDTDLLVKAQSPAPGTHLTRGGSVSVDQCATVPLSPDTSQCTSATLMTFCAKCHSDISGDYFSEVSGYSCQSASATLSTVSQAFGGCEVKAQHCPF